MTWVFRLLKKATNYNVKVIIPTIKVAYMNQHKFTWKIMDNKDYTIQSSINNTNLPLTKLIPIIIYVYSPHLFIPIHWIFHMLLQVSILNVIFAFVIYVVSYFPLCFLCYSELKPCTLLTKIFFFFKHDQLT